MMTSPRNSSATMMQIIANFSRMCWRFAVPSHQGCSSDCGFPFLCGWSSRFMVRTPRQRHRFDSGSRRIEDRSNLPSATHYQISIVRICMRARPRNCAALLNGRPNTLYLLPEQHSQWQVRRVYLGQSNGDRGRPVAARGPLDIPSHLAVQGLSIVGVR
jgi:hypothetical protein